MYTFLITNKFKKDFELIKKRNYDITPLNKIFSNLQAHGTVPAAHKPHKLSGKFSDCIECHIKPDWLLIYIKDEKKKLITLVRTGSHADLFK